MDKIKRFLLLGLALLLALGGALPAFAAFAPQVDSYDDTIVNMSGTPSGQTYNTEGSYVFRVRSGETEVEVRKPGSDSYEKAANITDNTFTYGGLTFTPIGESFVADMTFVVQISNRNAISSNGYLTSDDVKVNYLRVSRTRITRNMTANFEMVIVDPNTAHEEVQPDSLYLVFDQGSFSRSLGDDSYELDLAGTGVGGKATFNVTLNAMKYSGSGRSLDFTIYYTTSSGQEYAAPVSLSISQCEEYSYTQEEEEEDEPLEELTPYIIVDSYDYGGGSAVAGETFPLKLRIKNTSSTASLQNIVMNVSPGVAFSIANSSNTYYFNDLLAGATLEKVVELKAEMNPVSTTTTGNSNAVEITFKYQYVSNNARKEGSSSESISIPVIFPDRLEVGQIDMPSSCYVGEGANLYLPLVNKGKATVYNLSVAVEADGFQPVQSQYLGNLDAGNEDGIDLTLTPMETGVLSGVLVVSYEDSNMTPKETRLPFSLTAEEYPTFNPDDMGMGGMPGEQLPVEGEPEEESPLKGVTLLSAAIIALATGFATVLKIKAKRSIDIDED